MSIAIDHTKRLDKCHTHHGTRKTLIVKTEVCQLHGDLHYTCWRCEWLPDPKPLLRKPLALLNYWKTKDLEPF